MWIVFVKLMAGIILCLQVESAQVPSICLPQIFTLCCSGEPLHFVSISFSNGYICCLPPRNILILLSCYQCVQVKRYKLEDAWIMQIGSILVTNFSLTWYDILNCQYIGKGVVVRATWTSPIQGGGQVGDTMPNKPMNGRRASGDKLGWKATKRGEQESI